MGDRSILHNERTGPSPTAVQKKRPITRNRESLACSSCRSRKLKCDREQPCTSCIKRGDSDACVYGSKVSEQPTPTPSSSKITTAATPRNEDRVSRGEARLQHLESLVRDYVQHQQQRQQEQTRSNQSSIAATSSTPGLNPPNQPLLSSPNDNFYVGSTHFSAILEDLDDLRSILTTDQPLPPSTTCNPPTTTSSQIPTPTHPSTAKSFEGAILFGHGTPLPLSTILTLYLPSRQVVDRCLATYFRAEAIAALFIHVPQFRREYEAFWLPTQSNSPGALNDSGDDVVNMRPNPNANPLWVAQLFAICHLSRGTGHVIPASHLPAGSGGVPQFLEAAAQCLALGEWFRPQRYVVEAGIMWLQAKITSCLETPREVGVMFATVVRVAYAGGYHRDGRVDERVGGMTVFEAEMRRRTWVVLLQLDLLHSFELGLPGSIAAGSWDTREPRNLIDTDFGVDCVVLPEGRPWKEPTKIMFYLAKQRLVDVFDRILKYAIAPRHMDQDGVMLTTLDADLRTAYNTLPAHLLNNVRHSQAFTDPIFLVVTRRCTELMFHKCMCVLHRRHITQQTSISQSTSRLDSIAIATASATAIVRNVLDMYPEFHSPDGQFYGNSWVFSSITWHDFLLGIMVLCLVLVRVMSPTEGDAAFAHNPGPTRADVDVTAVARLLKAAREICQDRSEESGEAKRTGRLLDAVIVRVESLVDKTSERSGKTTGDGQSYGSAAFASTVVPTVYGSLSLGGSDVRMSGMSEQAVNVHQRANDPTTMPDWNDQILLDETTGLWDPSTNVFDAAEWAYLEESLSTDFMG